MIDVIHRLAISFLAGDLNPDWTHAALLGGSIAAEFAVAAGIVIESSWPKTWRQWLGIVLVIGGVIVGAAFTISLFVFDEAISQRQLDKIATLETEIAPRRLTADQEKTLAALFAKFPGQMVLFESYGKETEPFMLGMQILGTATEAGLPKKNELMTVDAIAGVKTGLCLSGTNKDFIEATKSAFLSFQMAPCALLGTPGAFSTVVSADEAFPLRIFVGIKPLSEETPHAAAETPHTAAHPIIRQNRSQRPWRLGL